MSNLSLRHIYKVYSNGCKAVSDFNMEIEDKEFIVFVGPSGCGKSTTLRMIAGLEEISAGELYIDDVLVNDMEPKDRDISMVFQNYALYPHMTVYDNMAFGLKLRHVSQEEIHKKVLWAAQVLKLTDYLDRKPRAMSGGQRQRVALGRAILRNPKVFLLDEPLSNLDAKLRTEMRAEITKLHQTLGTTFIYVTHDQVEAMTLGTRVVVMKLGYVQQIDTPQNLYKYPTNKFVAGFIGTPQMNFFEAKLTRDNDVVKVDFEGCDASFKANFNDLIKVRPSYLKGEQIITVGLRCENISVDPEVVKKSANVMKVKVSHFEELGAETLIYGDMNLERDGFEDSNTRVIIKCYNGSGIKAGDVVEAAFDMSKAHFFDKNTEESIAPRIPSENVFDSKIKNGAVDFLGNKLILPPAILREDMDDVELFIPSDAFNFDGNIKAKVVKTETINKQILLHLEINKRIFFVLSDKEYNEGEEVNIGVDIKRIKVLKGEEVIIQDLQNRNVFVGTYTNQQNDQKATKTIENYHKDIANKKIEKINHEKNIEIGKLGLNNVLLKEYKKEYQKAKDDAQADLSLQLGTLDLGKDGKKKAKEECAQKINLAKENFAKHKAEYNELKANVKSSPELKAQANEIAIKYDAEIQQINELTNEQINEYNVGRHNAQEFIKQSTLEEKQNYENALAELNKKHNEDLAKYAEEINNASSEEKKNEIKAQVAKINEQYIEDKDILLTNSKTFFININGHYVKSSPVITKKIVQALGIGIFNVNYRYEIALSSMKISNEGFKAEVIDVLDYGEDKYVLAKSHNNQLYVKADREYSKGEEIYIDFDIKDIHVFENKLDIRLY